MVDLSVVRSERKHFSLGHFQIQPLIPITSSYIIFVHAMSATATKDAASDRSLSNNIYILLKKGVFYIFRV